MMLGTYKFISIFGGQMINRVTMDEYEKYRC